MILHEEAPLPVMVKMPTSYRPLTAKELADWANTVSCHFGGKAVFTENEFPKRLWGDHCFCGTNKEGYTNGVFTLCALLSEVVTEGQKAYMICDKCGNYSHL